MRQRIITGVIFTMVVAAFIIPAYWFPLITVLFAIIVGSVAGYEMYKACKAGGVSISRAGLVISGVLALLSILATYLLKGDLLMALAFYLISEMILVLVLAVVPSIVAIQEDGFRKGIFSGSTCLYVTFPLFCLCVVALFAQNGWFLMLPALVSPWISDVFAYFTGVLFGKHKIVPHISPKKTWEGCIGGMLFCAAIFTVYAVFYIYENNEIKINLGVFAVVMFVLGMIISVMSQIGDWFASSIKRHVGIKDFGKFMPGHGGMLDRFDSAFFTLPMGVVFAIVAMYL